MITINLSNAEYHAHSSISKSGLDLVARSPAHFMYGEKRESTRAMVIGSAIHAAILEPQRFATDYMLLKDVADRRASEYKQAVKVHTAELVLVGHEADFVSGMQESVSHNQEASALLAETGQAELSVFTTDPETGVKVKCRFDWITESAIALDLKKTQDARAEAFSKSIMNYRYHVQAAFYSDVWQWETGEELQAFKFLAMEERMPHFAKLWQLDDVSLMIGRQLYREALNTYARCLDAGQWDMQDGGTELIALPNWVMNEFIDQELDNNE
jgi:exodeoxyribonuclease VIII